jgi:hypothetical protein
VKTLVRLSLMIVLVSTMSGCAADITKPDQKSCGESGNTCAANDNGGGPEAEKARGRQICEWRDNLCQCFCQPTITR